MSKNSFKNILYPKTKSYEKKNSKNNIEETLTENTENVQFFV